LFGFFNKDSQESHKLNCWYTNYPKEKANTSKKNKSIIQTASDSLSKSISLIRPSNKKSPFLNVIKPYYVDNSKFDYCKINNEYCFTTYINNFNTTIFEGLTLWPILSLPYDFDLKINVLPIDRKAALSEISKNEAKVKARSKSELEKIHNV